MAAVGASCPGGTSLDETVFMIDCLTQADVLDLASGCVPLSIQAQARALLDFEDADRRNAARLVRKRQPPRR